jgi:hypothetical protein
MNIPFIGKVGLPVGTDVEVVTDTEGVFFFSSSPSSFLFAFIIITTLISTTRIHQWSSRFLLLRRRRLLRCRLWRRRNRRRRSRSKYIWLNSYSCRKSGISSMFKNFFCSLLCWWRNSIRIIRIIRIIVISRIIINLLRNSHDRWSWSVSKKKKTN